MQHQEGNKSSLFLDSCILEYFLDRYQSQAVKELLKSLTTNYEFRISHFVAYELIKGAFKQKRDRIAELIINLKLTETDVNQGVLYIAALLESAYNRVGVEHTSDGDRIIAATAVIQNSLILTANTNDFPRPLFKEVSWHRLDYRKKNRPVSIYVALLSPDIEVAANFLSDL